MTVVFVKYGQTQFRKQQADSDTLFAVDFTFLARWKCTKECFLLFFVKLRTFILQKKKKNKTYNIINKCTHRATPACIFFVLQTRNIANLWSVEKLLCS